MPKVEKQKIAGLDVLYVNGEPVIWVNKILDYKLFHKGKMLSVICDIADKVAVYFLDLRQKIKVQVMLYPKPLPGFTIHLLGNLKDRTMRVLYKTAENENYVLFSGSLNLRKINDQAAEILIEEIGI